MVVRRKDPSLPHFAAIPSDALAAWPLEGTTIVELRANGVDLGRRTLKPWDREHSCWFVEFTEAHGLRTGDEVRLELRLASTKPPAEILDLIAADSRARAAWEAMTPAHRRQQSEHVRAAKQPETRLRRARRVLIDREDR